MAKKHPVIICRCNDVTEEDIVNAIRQGFTDPEELKRLLRIGMGPCQGRTCIPLMLRIVARETGRHISELKVPTPRPPVIPVPIKVAKVGGQPFAEGQSH
ncbi:MAG: (2Fe-2S)-binding protein [Candidatus Hydrothermota bacterium]|nr:MAG: (2Fe-2S)-binding protein [Candidatus Hydrothermae bacterium]